VEILQIVYGTGAKGGGLNGVTAFFLFFVNRGGRISVQRDVWSTVPQWTALKGY